MLKIVVFLLCAGVLYILIKNGLTARKKQEALSAKNMIKDPVCGTFVAEDTDIKLKYKGEIYAFCSEECKEKFRAKAGSKK